MDLLKLEEQLCFPIYAASRLITKRYTPILEELNLTYPQYICMMVLWENSPVKVQKIGDRLRLSSNTLTPLLKKLENKGYVKRTRSRKDEREVIINLTAKGRVLRKKAEKIPFKMLEQTKLPVDELTDLKERMWNFLTQLESIMDV